MKHIYCRDMGVVNRTFDISAHTNHGLVPSSVSQPVHCYKHTNDNDEHVQSLKMCIHVCKQDINEFVYNSCIICMGLNMSKQGVHSSLSSLPLLIEQALLVIYPQTKNLIQ